MAGHRVSSTWWALTKTELDMEKITLVLGFIICEVLMLGIGTAVASGVGFTIFSVAAIVFGIKHTNKHNKDI